PVRAVPVRPGIPAPRGCRRPQRGRFRRERRAPDPVALGRNHPTTPRTRQPPRHRHPPSHHRPRRRRPPPDPRPRLQPRLRHPRPRRQTLPALPHPLPPPTPHRRHHRPLLRRLRRPHQHRHRPHHRRRRPRLHRLQKSPRRRRPHTLDGRTTRQTRLPPLRLIRHAGAFRLGGGVGRRPARAEDPPGGQ